MPLWPREGVGEFSEDLPALLVVLVAISLFVSGATQAYSSFQEREKAARERERVECFIALLRSDATIIRDGQAGLFDLEALREANSASQILARYSSARVGFDHSLQFEISPIGGITENITFSASQKQEGVESVCLAAPCNFVEASGFVVPGRVSLTAWGLRA